MHKPDNLGLNLRSLRAAVCPLMSPGMGLEAPGSPSPLWIKNEGMYLLTPVITALRSSAETGRAPSINLRTASAI